MKIINLTPHTVNLIFAENGKTYRRSLPSEGEARAETIKKALVPKYILMETTGEDGLLYGEMFPIPVNRVVFGDVVGLPEAEDGIFYIVSRIVKNAIPHRSDCLVPDDIVRDDKGVIIGCRGFAL